MSVFPEQFVLWDCGCSLLFFQRIVAGSVRESQCLGFLHSFLFLLTLIQTLSTVSCSGNGKLASMPVGGAVAVSAGGGTAASAAAAAPAAGEYRERGVLWGSSAFPPVTATV